MVAATMNVAASEEKLLAFIGHLFDECRARAVLSDNPRR